ncbi:MAG TPA: DUF4245 domain-containing protein [Ornithinicoccus sp.]|nr:DUF4245 domain-containing protein [Ornithinicoccus sp.]
MDSPNDTQQNAPGSRSDEHAAATGASAPPENKTLARLRSYSVMNMVLSMLAVLALAFAWWALVPNPEGGPDRREVEVAPVSRYAAEQADFPVWTPETALGEEWTVNFVDYATFAGEVTWRIGLVSPVQEYVELSQTAEATDGWLTALTRKAGEEVGTRTITGPDGPQEWTAYEGEERALVLDPAEGRDATTVVRGTADWGELEGFIGMLEPASAD